MKDLPNLSTYRSLVPAVFAQSQWTGSSRRVHRLFVVWLLDGMGSVYRWVMGCRTSRPSGRDHPSRRENNVGYSRVVFAEAAALRRRLREAEPDDADDTREGGGTMEVGRKTRNVKNRRTRGNCVRDKEP